MTISSRLADSELLMWRDEKKETIRRLTDEEINDKYVRGDERIVVEANREELPMFVAALDKPNYINLKPFYQRRARWDILRQSTLIESFIINIPVPPVFLYEKQLNQYEVMDGQQRINAIKGYYNNEYALRGLERWPELNGKKYSDLPSKVRAGIDRRSISSFVLLHESAADDEEAMLLRRLVFERLNTGGVRLSRQEIRNAVNAGPFNDMMIALSLLDTFRVAWNVPKYSAEEDERVMQALARRPFYANTEDVETVLRFFALRHVRQYRNGMQGFLDIYMVRTKIFSQTDRDTLRTVFEQTLDLAVQIFQDLVFRPYDVDDNHWVNIPQTAFYDAVMVALSDMLDYARELVDRRDIIVEATKKLFEANEAGTFTGRANTRLDIETRITKFRDMLELVLKYILITLRATLTKTIAKISVVESAIRSQLTLSNRAFTNIVQQSPGCTRFTKLLSTKLFARG